MKKNLEAVFQGVTAEMLKQALMKEETKNKQINFRVSENDFAEIASAAQSVRLSMSAYLLKVHKFAYAKLAKGKGGVGGGGQGGFFSRERDGDGE